MGSLSRRGGFWGRTDLVVVGSPGVNAKGSCEFSESAGLLCWPVSNEPYLEVAIAARVVCLVTGNQVHFPSELCQGIKVLSPSEFLVFYKK